MSLPAPLQHPGPRAPDRFTALPCRAKPLTRHLAAGRPLDQAITEAFAAEGYGCGYLRLRDASFTRLAYVIPDRAPGDGRAAWYSETYRLAPAKLHDAGLHLGRREGAPFLHCHGLWSGAAGGDAVEPRMGHLLMPESVLAEDTVAEGWGLSGAGFEVRPDAETGFDLFTPVAEAHVGEGQPALLCKLGPNEDPHALLARAASELPRARVEGIGSLIDTRFEDGAQESYATEVLLHDGRIERGAVQLEASSVGFDGVPGSGTLRPGANRTCITAELLIIAA
ncbi:MULTISPECIES: hypothetical protein [Salipiger]|uniref:hypothetical protein n=1 Tax=Salipiger TaxID=263377 RepID=UPI003510F6D3